jgi:hypothetical protein
MSKIYRLSACNGNFQNTKICMNEAEGGHDGPVLQTCTYILELRKSVHRMRIHIWIAAISLILKSSDETWRPVQEVAG